MPKKREVMIKTFVGQTPIRGEEQLSSVPQQKKPQRMDGLPGLLHHAAQGADRGRQEKRDKHLTAQGGPVRGLP